MDTVNGVDLEQLLEDLAQLKKQINVLERTQDTLLFFLLDKMPSCEVRKLEICFLNAFADYDKLPDGASTILEVIRAFSTETFHRETKQRIRECFNQIPNEGIKRGGQI
jgi:hypothetical protein